MKKKKRVSRSKEEDIDREEEGKDEVNDEETRKEGEKAKGSGRKEQSGRAS